jgi:hypothetical protein
MKREIKWSDVRAKLAELGLTLPVATLPLAAYVPQFAPEILSLQPGNYRWSMASCHLPEKLAAL